MSDAAVRRGLQPPGRQFYLPVQASGEVGEFTLDAEVGYNFAQQEPDEWAVGFIVAHACGPQAECHFEIRESLVPHDSQTLINFGYTRRLSGSLVLLSALGRQFGVASPERQNLLLYLGLQLQRH